jgi:hypothetical protein
MPVDDPEPRDRERVGRDLPREEDADGYVWVVRAQQRRHAVRRGRDDDVKDARRIPHVLEKLARRVFTRAKERDGFVSETLEKRGETACNLSYLGNDDDAHASTPLD